MLGTLRHEYVHALTASRVPDAPSWLDEGLAEFWGAAVVDGDRVVIGRPVARHVKELRRRNWLPMSTVLNQQRGSLPSSPGQVPMFYAQSWAMVQYLLLEQDGGKHAAFVPAIDTWSSQFEASLRRYVADGGFREVSVPWQPPAALATMTSAISESRALAERANMLVSGAQLNGALAAARRALAINPGEALALEVVGTYYFLSNEREQARDWLDQALGARVTYRAALYMSLLATSPSERERYLTLAVLSKPDSMVAWQRLGDLLEQDGRLESSRRWCRLLSTPLLARLFLGHTTPFCRDDRQ